ncbi:gluconokinase [Mucilaginibacter terrenus]|uniref:Gluconokinase n=1 Tax=Mucilaginibacter terrenus TaxID=2482727 RepID=A0A3E2NUM2_9SPHI|nr:gluconokinase [Mucilaginibacter terrenus]RFZ84550.1 gluconokinase [Mucilaginibacter terrenus]
MSLLRLKAYFVGIDLGTGSTKAVATDELGNTIYTTQQHYPTITSDIAFNEQDVSLIWQAFKTCLNDVIAHFEQSPTAVSFSSAMHSIMPLDANGNPLTNAMIWSDARSGEIAQSLRESVNGENLYRTTGTAIYAMSPLCKIMWLRENRPELFAATYKFISIKEYIWYKLFGVYEVDHSIASATGMFDILQRTWYPKALELAAINATQLSVAVSTTYIRRITNGSFPGIAEETAFVIGASDGCCANLGGNAIRPGVGALTIGTSGAVRVGSNKPAYNYKAMTFNYLLNEQTFICGGAVNNGGAAIDWLLKDFLGLEPVSGVAYNQLFKTIKLIRAGSEGLVFLPYLYAERAPVWDAKSSGAFLNIRPKHTQAHFLRAALEGVCFALNDVLNAVEESSSKVNEIVASGGFISSPVWVQILADITGKKLVLQEGGDSSALGAIYLAMEALGIDIAPILAKADAEAKTINPNQDAHQTYTRVFAVYRQLYADVRSAMHKLHDLDL